MLLARVSIRRCTPSLFSATLFQTTKYNFSTSVVLDRYYRLTQAYKEEQEKRKKRLAVLKESNVDPRQKLVQEYYKNKKMTKQKLSKTEYASIAEQKPSSRIMSLLFDRVAMSVKELYTTINEQYPGILKSKSHLRHILTILRSKKRVKTVANPAGHRENHLYILTFSQHKRMKDRRHKMQQLGSDVGSLLEEVQQLTGGSDFTEQAQHAKAE